jgi:hypothetical protein
MEKQRAVIKFKAAARIACVTHELTNIVRIENSSNVSSQDDETAENGN